ncbi:hypothetical protein DV737_g1501, partial [Chaetothyriales sp. CBS 132003]
MNIFGLEPVVKFGSEEQRKKFLVPLIAGKERACFGVTEPNTGLDTLRLQTRAVRDGDHYLVTGSKIWISTAQNAQKILLLARTTPLSQVTKPSHGLSLFYTDLDPMVVEITEIPKMGRAAVDTNMLLYSDWRVPASDRIGAENEGFKMIMHGMNAERILIGAEALGLGYAALRRAAIYAGERNVFGRPIGKNQAIQHPLADSWMQLEAARLMIYQAAKMYDQGYQAGDVYQPAVIVNQMRLTDFHMLLVFLTASAASTIAIAAANYSGHARLGHRTDSSYGWFIRHDANIIGGALLGAGMSLTGACPGTILVQLGAELLS